MTAVPGNNVENRPSPLSCPAKAGHPRLVRDLLKAIGRAGSPATQAGFSRLEHFWVPISGKPEIGAGEHRKSAL